MLTTSGQQFQDWSANYRVFEQERIAVPALFSAVIAGVIDTLPDGAPIVGAIGDTLIRKKGRRIAGTSVRRDPLGRRLQTISSGRPAFFNSPSQCLRARTGRRVVGRTESRPALAMAAQRQRISVILGWEVSAKGFRAAFLTAMEPGDPGRRD
jgi:hypothetical protein